jgi:predicted kinase
MVHSRTVVVLSGPTASGKTTLAENLKRLRGAACVSTSSLIAAKAGHDLDRSSLQDLGMTDAFQAGDWLVDALRHVATQSTDLDVLVVDALRTIAQLHAIKKASRGIWKVLHVHLTGEEGQLADRSQARREDAETWDQMMSSPAEQAVQALALEADTVIDTTRTTPADVADTLRLRTASWHKAHYLLIE